MNGRPGLQEALQAVERDDAQALVVAKLDRLSRSLLDFASLMDRGRKRGWSLVALDLGVDTSTPSGEMMASVLATFAQFERRLIGQRTRDALAVKRAQGVQLGRPREISEQVVERIGNLHATGLTVAAIARKLNDENVPTPRGGRGIPPASSGALLGSRVKNAGYSEARESGLARLRDRQPRAGRAALTETARATRRVPLHSEDHHALVRLQRDCLVADLDKLPGELVVPGPVAMHRDVTDDLALGQVGLRVPPLDRRVERGLPRVEVRDGGRASSRRLDTRPGSRRDR